jgi:hypothetical protein
MLGSRRARRDRLVLAAQVASRAAELKAELTAFQEVVARQQGDVARVKARCSLFGLSPSALSPIRFSFVDRLVVLLGLCVVCLSLFRCRLASFVVTFCVACLIRPWFSCVPSDTQKELAVALSAYAESEGSTFKIKASL